MVILCAITPVILFSERFDTVFPPSGWRIFNGGDTLTWKPVRKGYVAFENPNFSDIYAICSSDIGYDAVFDDSLITPSIYLGTYAFDSVALRLDFAFKKFPGDPDTAKILLSSFSGVWSPYNEVMVISYDSVFSSQINITPYISGADSVKVAFWYGTRFWDYYFGIDNIKVIGYKLFNWDMSADSIIKPAYAIKDSTYNLKFMVSNRGRYTENLRVIFGVYPSLDTADITLPPNTTGELTKLWTPTTIGIHTLVLTVFNLSDEYRINDTLIDSLEVYTKPVKLVVVPYDTATPVIDGFIMNSSIYDNGWIGAVEVDISDYMGLGGGKKQVTGSCKLLMKHDGNHIFVGVLNANDGTVSPLDALKVLLDDNGDGTWAPDSSEGINNIYSSFSSGWQSIYITPMDTGTPVLRGDLAGLFSFSSQPLYYYSFQVEAAIPIDTLSKDPAKIDTRIGDTSGIFVAVFSQDEGEHVCWWPQNALNTTDILNSAKIILSPRVGIYENPRRNSKNGRVIYAVDGRKVKSIKNGGVYFILINGKFKKVIKR